MTDEQRIVYVQGLLLQARVELEAMLAANQTSIIINEIPVYGEKEIIDIIDKHRIHHHGLMAKLFGWNYQEMSEEK